MTSGKIRVIRYSNENGSREGVYFTEDFDLLVDDITPIGCEVDDDTIIEVYNWLPLFPMDYNLEIR
jgi:hypothetical protein